MNDRAEKIDEEKKPLRYGWTTGACATAAAKAAYQAMLAGKFPKSISITLPKGQTPTFKIEQTKQDNSEYSCAVIKDAGDDPDVTHGALILVALRKGPKGKGISYEAGKGVGTVTKKGLTLPVGEPAINPAPRKMIEQELNALAKEHGKTADLIVKISIPNGETLAKNTLNGRLGILGGLSILGTTGIVVPYSCSAWIHSIHRGVDVALAEGITHLYAAVGKTSEDYLHKQYQFEESALLEMGDFAGGLLKYIKKHPPEKLTLAGGFAKFSKLANGAMDLHSKRSQVDLEVLANELKALGADGELVAKAKNANTGLEVLQLAEAHDFPLGDVIAKKALQVAEKTIKGAKVKLEVICVDRQGKLVGHASQ